MIETAADLGEYEGIHPLMLYEPLEVQENACNS